MLSSVSCDLVHRPKTHTVLIIALKDILSPLLQATLAQTTSRTEQREQSRAALFFQAVWDWFVWKRASAWLHPPLTYLPSAMTGAQVVASRLQNVSLSTCVWLFISVIFLFSMVFFAFMLLILSRKEHKKTQSGGDWDGLARCCCS